MRFGLLVFYTALFVAGVLPAVIFAVWIYLQPWELKDKIAAWDPFVKTMAIAGAAIIGVAAFEKFLDQRQQELAKEMIAGAQGREDAFGLATKTTAAIAAGKDLVGSAESK